MRSIAIVGMACRYPDARTPRQLWENVLAQRPAFRRIPPERLRIQDYQNVQDSIRCEAAALIEGFEFDRAGYRISADTFRSVDLSHWLALEVAGELVRGLPCDSLGRQTGVYVGNTLTSEFTRANLMRLRWPYVERVLREALKQTGGQNAEPLLSAVEALYKAPFPPTGEESLAGGLSNTIAGRICNTFNFQGGGFTIDGACASSLLAVAHACSALENGSVAMALAGGVDLSLDPFELAGFSAIGAVSTRTMRVFDKHPTGFLPGEGCGFVALMREEDALAHGVPVLARMRGWGISSDGHGGITRPEVGGQMLALERAYQSAGCDIGSVAYFEGHGTGTAVGDTTELTALAEARRLAGAERANAAVGSIKALIGHTKAAAGVASLIKAVCAVGAQVIPPTAGCEEPHPLAAGAQGLRCPKRAEVWPKDSVPRAGVSAMGFGGINCHVVLEGVTSTRRTSLSRAEQLFGHTRQDCEVFPFSAPDPRQLLEAAMRLRRKADGLSIGELADCSASLASTLDARHSWRAAVVASTTRELAARLDRLALLLGEESSERVLCAEGVYCSNRAQPARIGLLFPGQSSPVYRDGGVWARRFPKVDELYQCTPIPAGEESETSVAQPAIATASRSALLVLDDLNIAGQVALGHSLGELLALGWAEALPLSTVLELAGDRGRLMAEAATAQPGAMLSVRAPRDAVESMACGLGLVVACHNAESQTVISGSAPAIHSLQAMCLQNGIESTLLPVACAFHSPLMRMASERFGALARTRNIGSPRRRIVSSFTGAVLHAETDVAGLLEHQITAPVEFASALACARSEADVWIEAGPGRVLTHLAGAEGLTVIALDAGGPSIAGLCHALAAAFVLKHDPSFECWFRDRSLRPFSLELDHKFFANPCEGEWLESSVRPRATLPAPAAREADVEGVAAVESDDCLMRLRQLVASRTQLPLDTILGEHRFLTDLHLNSITVTQMVAQAATDLGLPLPVLPVNYSTVTLADAAAGLENLRLQARTCGAGLAGGLPVPGVDSWVRPFAVDWVGTAPPKMLWNPEPAGDWRVLTDSAGAAAEVLSALRPALEANGSGLLVYLADPIHEETFGLLLSAARALADGAVSRLALVQERRGGAEAFVRSLYLEHPSVNVTIVTGTSTGADRLAAEILSTSGIREVMFGNGGARQERRLRALAFPEGRGFPLMPGQRLLVTGGGRGIALECGLALACRHRLKLAIMGRSDPTSDAELGRNLERVKQAGIEFTYHRADVADALAVGASLENLQIDGVIHAAGVNIPEPASQLTEGALRATLGPKRDGLRNVLAAVAGSRPVLVAAFGSVIGQTGLDGEAHYALANDWMARELACWSADHPGSHALQIDWSVWSGTGMGERLGTLDRLMRRGISPISIDSGIDGLDRLLRGSQPGFQTTILTGRFRAMPTLSMEEPDLPLERFLEVQVSHTPGVELICEAALTDAADPYLADHELDGLRLFPAVMGLEAMAQACLALQGNLRLTAISNVEFARPVVLPQGGTRRIRIAALVREPGIVDAVIRSDETGFQVDHSKATYVFREAEETAVPVDKRAAMALDPRRDLYGSILFHRGRFQRIDGYLELGALRCRSLVRTGPEQWFGDGLPEAMRLGDPGARDAAIHSVQACIPQYTLLPVRVDRIDIADIAAEAYGQRMVTATERSHQGSDYVYDLQIADQTGRILERWTGLTLRKFDRALAEMPPLASALLVPYLEWAAAELNTAVAVAVHASGEEGRTERGRQVAERLAGSEGAVRRRPDGKPEVDAGTISFSHMEPLTLGVRAASGCVSCDLVPVQSVAPDHWPRVLGDDLYAMAGLVSQAAREPIAHSAARVWAAMECLQKSGADPGRPITFRPERSNGWMCFGAATQQVLVGMLRLRVSEGPVAVALLADPAPPPARMAPAC